MELIKMTNQDLQKLVSEISMASFGRPFKHQAVFNGRLQSTGGRYHLVDHHIDINPRILSEFGRAALEGTIKHELCHYHLHLAGQTGKHNTTVFKQLLRQVGGLRYSPIKPQRRQTTKYLYECVGCGQQYPRQRRINLAKYRCGRCHHRLVLK